MSSKLTQLSKIKQLSDSVISVLGCNPGPRTLLGTNTYLVGKGRERILIDTGDSNVIEYQKSLRKVLDDTGAFISQIVITHHHIDHIGGLDDVRKLCDRDIPAYKLAFPSHAQADHSVKAYSNLNYVEDQHVFTAEGVSLKVIHNPGHCADHMILWYEEEQAVFSGDSVLGEGTTEFRDLSAYMKSLHVIKSLNPTVMYPGHGPVIRSPQPHIDYYIRHRQDREDQVVELLGQSKHTATSIVKVLYKDYPAAILGVAAKVILLHLRKLETDGKAQCEDSNEHVDSVWKLCDK